MAQYRTRFAALGLALLTLGTGVRSGSADDPPSTIAVANCSQAAVQAALDAADEGDTVSIPAGSCLWPDGIAWTNKNIILQGAGIDQTIISCTQCVRITSTAATSAYSHWRLTGLTF